MSLHFRFAAVIPIGLLFSSQAFAQASEETPEVQPVPEADSQENPASVESTGPSDSETESTPEAVAVEEAESGEVGSSAEEQESEPESPPAEAVEEAPQEEVAVPVATESSPEEEAVPSLLPLKVGTHTFSRFEYRQNYDSLGVSRTRFQEGDRTVFRSRLTIGSAELQLTDTITGSVYVAPQASGSWGTQGIGGTIGEANLGIYEGYFKLQGKRLTGKVGRFAMNYGDAGVIGNLDWHESGRAFDGAHFSYAAGKAKIDAFATQTNELYPASPEPFLGGDNYFWGVYAMVGKTLSESLDLDIYALGKSAAARDISIDDGMGNLTSAHVDGGTHVTFGARAKQKIASFDYRAEAGLQVGKTPGPLGDAVDKFAYQANGEIGIAPATGMRVSLGAAVASGNDGDTADKDEAYDELYPTTHKWLGLTDVIGFRTNIVSANVGFKANITQSTIFKLQGHMFSRMEDNGLGRAMDASSKLAGFEVDTHVVQKIGKWAYSRAMYGIFLANEDHYGSGDNAHFLEVQAGLKF